MYLSNLGSNLKGHTFNLTSFFCEGGVGFSLQWKEPYRDKDLISGYNVSWREETISNNGTSGLESVGMNTTYNTPCSLIFKPGRLYWTTVKTLAVLRNPREDIVVDESPNSIIIGKKINWKSSKETINFHKFSLGNGKKSNAGNSQLSCICCKFYNDLETKI